MNDSNDVNSCEEASPVWLVHIGSPLNSMIWWSPSANTAPRQPLSQAWSEDALPKLMEDIRKAAIKVPERMATLPTDGYRIQRDSMTQKWCPQRCNRRRTLFAQVLNSLLNHHPEYKAQHRNKPDPKQHLCTGKSVQRLDWLSYPTWVRRGNKKEGVGEIGFPINFPIQSKGKVELRKT